MRGLDLRKFKKVLVEKDATHLEHPSGHKIIISHKLMGNDMKRQLDALPMYDGGSSSKHLNVPEHDRTEQFNQAAKRVDKNVHHEVGYSDGGDVSATDDDTKKAFEKAFKKPEPKPTPPQTQEDKYEAIRRQNRANVGYADGGQVPTPQPMPSTEEKRKQVSVSFKKALGFADGGQPIQGEAQQVPASQLEADYSAEQAAAQGETPQAAEGQNWADQIGNEIPNENPNTPIAPVDASHAHLAEAVKNLSSKYSNTPVAAEPTPQVPQQGLSQGLAQPQQVPDQQPSGDLIQQAKQDVGLANKAETAAAQNVQQAQAQNAEIYGQKGQHLQELAKKYEDIGNQIHQKFEDLSSQVAAGHVDPSKWWNSKSTGSKVMTAIGMLFAGAGGGVSGHPEMAGKAIDDAINRDIDAQKVDLSNKQSLLGKYMEMYNSLPQAENAARLTMEASVEGLINQQAAKLGSQNAQNAATISNAQRRQALLPQLESLAKGQAMTHMYQSMGKQSSSQGGDAEASHQKMLSDLAVLNPERYKIEEAKYLPGIGIAVKPVPEKVVDEITARKDLSEKLAELENFSREHSGTVLDRKIVNQGAALARNVQDAYRRGNAQGVFKESEKNFVEQSINSDPTAFFSKVRTLPGYQTVRKLNDDTIKHYQKAYGVKPFQQQSQGNQNQAAMEWLQANPNDPRAAAVRKKLGM